MTAVAGNPACSDIAGLCLCPGNNQNVVFLNCRCFKDLNLYVGVDVLVQEKVYHSSNKYQTSTD